MGVRLVKYLFACLLSIISLLIAIGRIEGHMPWRTLMQMLPSNDKKEWNDNEKREYRKKEYKGVIIFWAITTVAAIIFVIFFFD